MGNGLTRPYYDPEKNGGRLRGKAAYAAPQTLGPPPYRDNDEEAVLRAVLSNTSPQIGSPQLSVCLSLSHDIFKTPDSFSNAEGVALAIKALQYHKETGGVYRVKRVGTHQWSQVIEDQSAGNA